MLKFESVSESPYFSISAFQKFQYFKQKRQAAVQRDETHSSLPDFTNKKS